MTTCQKLLKPYFVKPKRCSVHRPDLHALFSGYVWSCW